MTIGAGNTILASDVQSIKDDVDSILAATAAGVGTPETTASTSYTDLATSGPSVTVTTGTSALVIVSALLYNSTTQQSFMSHAVSGATTSAANDAYALSQDGTGHLRASRVYLRTLTAGSNTFTAKFKVDGGTGTFAERRIIVIPLGV